MNKVKRQASVNFNARQQEAYSKMLGVQRVLVTGPPGTGKSFVLREYIGANPHLKFLILAKTHLVLGQFEVFPNADYRTVDSYLGYRYTEPQPKALQIAERYDVFPDSTRICVVLEAYMLSADEVRMIAANFVRTIFDGDKNQLQFHREPADAALVVQIADPDAVFTDLKCVRVQLTELMRLKTPCFIKKFIENFAGDSAAIAKSLYMEYNSAVCRNPRAALAEHSGPAVFCSSSRDRVGEMTRVLGERPRGHSPYIVRKPFATYTKDDLFRPDADGVYRNGAGIVAGPDFFSGPVEPLYINTPDSLQGFTIPVLKPTLLILDFRDTADNGGRPKVLVSFFVALSRFALDDTNLPLLTAKITEETRDALAACLQLN